MPRRFLPIPIGTDQSQTMAMINRNFAELDADTSLRVLKTGVAQVSSSGSTVNWTSVPHNLGVTPIAMGFLNNSTVGSITTNGSVPLPTWTSVTADSGVPALFFEAYVQVIPDDTYVHIVLLNSTAAPISALNVTYYLLEQTAVRES